jgi:hypothetical protein
MRPGEFDERDDDHDVQATPRAPRTRHSTNRSVMRRADGALKSGTTCIKLKKKVSPTVAHDTWRPFPNV